MIRFSLLIILVFSLPPGRTGAQHPDPGEASPSGPALPLLEMHSPAEGQDQFWIVSSRSCAQNLNEMRNCRLDVWEMDARSLAGVSGNGDTHLSARRCELREAEFRHALIPGVPVCIFVHGSYINRDRVTHYSRRTYEWLRQAQPGRPFHFIFFTWPSDPITYLPQPDFNELGDRAGVNGFYLSRVIHHIPVDSPVSLIGHSQGGSTVVSAMHLLAGGKYEGYRLPPEADRGHRIRAVLAAAAVDQQWLNPGERYGRALGRTESLLNLVNRRDWALGFYHLRSLGSGRALSRHGFRTVDYRLMGPLALKIHQLDVTNTIGRDHTWPSYYSVPSLAHSISPYVYFEGPQVRKPVKVLTPPKSSQTRFAGGSETLQRSVSK